MPHRAAPRRLVEPFDSPPPLGPIDRRTLELKRPRLFWFPVDYGYSWRQDSLRTPLLPVSRPPRTLRPDRSGRHARLHPLSPRGPTQCFWKLEVSLPEPSEVPFRRRHFD